jgi:bifunctional non-homologous end joining protein LigD
MPPHRAITKLLPGTDTALAELPEEEPRFTKRMECVAVDSVRKIPSSDRWFREIKWDGYRVCVVRKGKKASVCTKANLPPSARYQHIEAALARSELPDCVLDAELVALDSEERPVFQLLQQSRRNTALVVVYIFDVLNYAGRDLKRLPLQKRRAVLDAIADSLPDYVRASPLLPEDTPMDRLVRALDENRLEGIVVKRKDSTYLEGKSSGSWIKHRLYAVGEFIIGGYLKRGDPYFDALIVGEQADGRLLYKEKVRFGFDEQKKSDLLGRMKPLITSHCPFDNLPEAKRRGSLNPQQMREAVWVKPELHCTVEYTEKTESGNIRGHGRFGELLVTGSGRR